MDTYLILTLLFIVFLLILSAFFSGSETGLTAVSRAKIHRLKTEGNRRAEQVSKLCDDKERLIGAILLGNNMVNILASALATGVLIDLFGQGGIAYATVIMTLLVLIFAEVMPKTYAIQHSERVALFVAPILRIFVWIFAPVTHLVQWFVNQLFGIFAFSGNGDLAQAGSLQMSATDELKGTIELHHSEGGVQKNYKDMLGSILDLNEREVSEVMVHRTKIEMIDVSKPSEEIISAVLSSTRTRIPLWKDNTDNIVGVLHVKDLLKALQEWDGEMAGFDIMTCASKPWFIPETTTLSQQLSAFRSRKKHFALVVDEYGALQGLVTLEDILEEIVGEIWDEHDELSVGIYRVGSGRYFLDGSVTIRDLNRALEWDLPDEDASTVAGLIIHQAEEIPEIGSEFEFFGVRFTIVRKESQRITGIEVEKVQPIEASANRNDTA